MENPSDSSSAPNITTTKRYAPPFQRNRTLGRRKSGGDRFERINNSMNDGEKNQVANSRNVPLNDHGDAAVVIENLHPRVISLHGCCKSDAFQLLNERWAAAINAFNDPRIDFADRPVMYTGSGGSAWGQFRLPHQFSSRVPVGPSSGAQMDFLSELRYAMDSNASSAT